MFGWSSVARISRSPAMRAARSLRNGPCGSFSATLRCCAAALLHQAVGAIGEPDRAHAAGAEHAHQPVRADRFTRRVRVRRRAGTGINAASELGQGARERIALGLRGAAQQFADQLLQVGVRRRQGGQPGVAVLRRQVERGVEQRADARPGLCVDAERVVYRKLIP